LTACSLLDEQLKRIRSSNSSINALVYAAAEDVLRAKAVASDDRRRRGQALSVLDGLTLAVKDNIDVAGMPTTAGLGLRRQPTQDAAVVASALAAGMLIVGKLNMDEAALGATTNNPHLGRCHNPLRRGYTPGGSSGGSGAWVAAAMGACALGTDTMGSVRIPAAYCGVSGLKPTRGWLPEAGVVPVCSSLDTVGPLARQPKDLMPLLSLLSGRSPENPVNSVPLENEELALGWVEGLVLTPKVEEHLTDLCCRLQAAGFRLQPATFGSLDLSAVRRAGLLLSELDMLKTHQQDLKSQPQAFSSSLTAMLNWAKKQPSKAAVVARTRLAEAVTCVDALMNRYDWLLLPTTGQTSFAFESPVPVDQADLTAVFSVSGHPALSFPAGRIEGLPVGLQLVGRRGSDFELVQVAGRLFESLLDGETTYD